MNQYYRHEASSVNLLNYHFVWILRRRRKVLKGAIARRLGDLLHEVAQQINCEVLKIEILEDHVHLLLNCPPTLSPREIMFRVKAQTARKLRKEFPDPLLKMPSMWTRDYFVSTAESVSSETVQQYVENQPKD